MKLLITVLITLFGLTALSCTTETKEATPEPVKSANQSAIRVFSVETSFEYAKEDLLNSIIDRGLVISYTAHAKTMFDRTADITGGKEPVYNDAEILLFCKADSSYNLVAADPHNLILCPYAIAIYVLHAEPDRVYLSYREQDESQAVTKPISDLLASIIDDVI